MSNDENNLDELMTKKKSKSKHSDILSQLKDFEDDSYASELGYSSTDFLPSSLVENLKEDEKEDDETSADAWFNDMLESSNIKINKHGRRSGVFDFNNGIIGKKKKKKKKKNKDDDLIDFRKEFEPEAALYKNLLVEQSRFTESLQKEYDAIKSVKSSSRGVTKQLSDLIENITCARTLAMQLVDKQVAIKKQAAELNMKQAKENKEKNGDIENMTDFASAYLKNMLNNRNTLFNDGENSENFVSDYTEDELLNAIGDVTEDNRPDEVNLYLKYENSNIKIYVVITDNDVENYEFIAKDENGEIISDYPLPVHTNISVNRSTNIATDIFGKKYSIIWE